MPSNEQQAPVLGTRITNPTVGYALCCALAGLVSALPPGARAGALSLQTKPSGPFLRPLICGGPRHRAQGLQPTAQGISAYRDPGGISCSGEVYRSLLTLLFTSPRRGLLFSCARGARLPSKRRRGDPMHQWLFPFPPRRRPQWTGAS
jgi:hypothetical protein